MTKADVVDLIAEATGLTKVETEAVIDGFLTTIVGALKAGERVDFRGFGSFNVKKAQARRSACRSDTFPRSSLRKSSETRSTKT